jgi:alpha-mannosidase
MRTLHVISHTHWDREWYRTFQQFRLRLVHLIDGLLDLLERDPEYKHFMLDGQTIVLDDYLLMRPEKELILRQHIQNGRIVIGPWHILPDMFLVGPEAHIRNLLEGDRTCRKFGPKMMIGYMPDSFGHIQQMPQILRGFGMDAACLWRGVEDGPAEFWWQAPDGSRVLMAYLRDSYSNGAALPTENLPLFAKTLAEQGQSLADHAATNEQLIMLGTDHMEPPANTSEAIAYADEMLRDTHVIHSTLPQYVAAITAAIESQPAAIPTLAAELRACRRMHLLPGVLSTRMWIKQRNTASENLLTQWAEPFSTFQELAANNIQQPILRQKAAIIRQAWRLLMENHPHDSICGCSIDQVHDEMKPRFDQVDQIGEELVQQSLMGLADVIHTQPSTGSALAAIVVFNPHTFSHTDCVQAEFPLPQDVGGFEISDDAGNILPHETLGMGTQELINSEMDRAAFRSAFGVVNEGRVTGLGVRAFTVRREGPTVHLDIVFRDGDPDKAAWEDGVKVIAPLLDDPTVTTFHVRARTADRVNVIFRADGIPGLGWRTFYVRGKALKPAAPVTLSAFQRALLPIAGRLASTPLGAKLLQPRQASSKPPAPIENEFFRVEVEPAGTLSIFGKRSGISYLGMNRFVDGGDSGDEYNYSPPLTDSHTTARLTHISVQRGAARQILTLNLVLKTPVSLSVDRRSRSQNMVEIPLKTVVTLTAGVPRIDVHTEIENTAQDHRLRVHFSTHLKVDEARYDGHFEVIRRKIGLPAFDRATWGEDPRPEAPQRAFVEISAQDGGLILANRGLPEVEVLRQPDTNCAEIALTLLRCVGWLSRDDFQTRRGHAGPNMATPGAQMPGQWAFDYAIIPFSGNPPSHQAYAFETPLRAVNASLHNGDLPSQGSFVAVETKNSPTQAGANPFRVSAIKQTEDGKGWLVRGYNPGDQPLEITLTPFKRFKSAVRVNLAEQILTELALTPNTGSVSLPVKSCEIVSVAFYG